MGSFSAHENATAFHWSACQDSKYAFKIKLSDHALSPLRAFALTLAELFKVAIIAFGFGRLVLLVFFFACISNDLFISDIGDLVFERNHSIHIHQNMSVPISLFLLQIAMELNYK